MRLERLILAFSAIACRSWCSALLFRLILGLCLKGRKGLLSVGSGVPLLQKRKPQPLTGVTSGTLLLCSAPSYRGVLWRYVLCRLVSLSLWLLSPSWRSDYYKSTFDVRLFFYSVNFVPFFRGGVRFYLAI